MEYTTWLVSSRLTHSSSSTTWSEDLDPRECISIVIEISDWNMIEYDISPLNIIRQSLTPSYGQVLSVRILAKQLISTAIGCTDSYHFDYGTFEFVSWKRLKSTIYSTLTSPFNFHLPHPSSFPVSTQTASHHTYFRLASAFSEIPRSKWVKWCLQSQLWWQLSYSEA